MRRCVSCVVLCLLLQLSVAEASGPASNGAVEAPAASAVLRGRVVDTSGGAVTVPGSRWCRCGPASHVGRHGLEGSVRDRRRARRLRRPGRRRGLRRDGASPRAGGRAEATADFTLEIAVFHESVAVEGAGTGYAVPVVSSATRTSTPLRDVPQAVSVVSRALIADQRMSSMADVTRYMPGVGFAQGEGNRDTPILRGNSTTADFFVDGVRDDVQYFRDVYNVERVEALKGPNAMIFGRGGVGGVLNRVTRQADWGCRGKRRSSSARGTTCGSPPTSAGA